MTITAEQPKDIPGVTRPFTLAEAIAEAQKRYQMTGAIDPISPDPAELPGGGMVFWDPTVNRAIIKPYNPKTQLTPTTHVITTGQGGSPEIILPPRNS